MFAPVPIPPSLSGEHRWLRWMLDQKGGGLGQERTPGPQPSKQQKSHHPILAVPQIGQLGQACCVHLDLCGALSYRNCSVSAIGEACRLTTQKEFSRTSSCQWQMPLPTPFFKSACIGLLGITGLNLFSFLGPNSTKYFLPMILIHKL